MAMAKNQKLGDPQITRIEKVKDGGSGRLLKMRTRVLIFFF